MVDITPETLIKNYLEAHEIIGMTEPTGDISSSWVSQNEDLQSLEEPISIAFFNLESQSRKKEMELRVLKKITETQKHNDKLEDYNPKLAEMNRYNTIIPYKHSKVPIKKLPGEEKIDDPDNALIYINANYINTIFNDQAKFIATQGPNFNSFQNFWKMIFFENTELILMLCEKSRTQCDEYWPKHIGSSLQWPKEAAELKVTLEEETIVGLMIERKFSVERIIGEEIEKKNVNQLQWLGWPDNGAPTDYDTVLNLIERMINIHIMKPEKKIVVHCSAGVGRTGTLMALFNLVLLLKKYLPMINEIIYAHKHKTNQDNSISLSESLKKYQISIFGVVRKLREQRWGMVHSTEQYLYLYDFIGRYIEKNLLH